MDNETLMLVLADMLRYMEPHGWIDDYTAQYYAPGNMKFYNVHFTSNYEISHIEVLDLI